MSASGGTNGGRMSNNKVKQQPKQSDVVVRKGLEEASRALAELDPLAKSHNALLIDKALKSARLLHSQIRRSRKKK
jgi:hypothetical protein